MMTMLMPTRRNFFNDLMADPFDAFFNTPFTPAQKSSSTLMRTDIKETDAGFELTIDLPGFKKDDVQAELKDGYLTVPEGPGIGIELNESAMNDYPYKPRLYVTKLREDGAVADQ